MKNFFQTILKITAILVVVFTVLALFIFIVIKVIDKNEVVKCSTYRNQAIDFPEAYSKWAKENSKVHSLNVEACNKHNIKIPVL